MNTYFIYHKSIDSNVSYVKCPENDLSVEVGKLQEEGAEVLMVITLDDLAESYRRMLSSK